VKQTYRIKPSFIFLTPRDINSTHPLLYEMRNSFRHGSRDDGTPPLSESWKSSTNFLNNSAKVSVFSTQKPTRLRRYYTENPPEIQTSIYHCSAVFGIRDILVRIRILESVLVTNGSGCGSCSFLKFSPLRLYAYSFLKVHLHHSSKIKSHTEATKQ
jgi:hypothetical protein